MTAQKKKIVFVINPNSGTHSSSTFIKHVKKALDLQFDWNVHLTERANHATEIAAEAVKNGVDAIIAVGGDGTVNEVSRALINTETAFGVIPSGSGNGFARHLKIPLSERAALKRIEAFKTIRIDTAILNNVSFVATAGLGFDAEVGWRFSELDKRGMASYVKATADTFFKFKPENYDLVIDGKEMSTKAFLLTFANVGQYGNNVWIAPSASVTDGKLNVCILKEFPPLLAPEILFRLFNRQIEESKYYQMIHAENILVKNPKKFHLDGEPFEASGDLHIAINPASLNVIV